jgi:3'-5' exoribonuclease
MNENTPEPSSNATSASPPAEPSSAEPDARLEKVRKVYVRDLEHGERVNTVFLVTRKARNTGRSGKTYLSLVLSDKTGDIDARIFDDVDRREAAFAAGDYVLAQGEVITFHGKGQILISEIERLDPEPIDRKEFGPVHSMADESRAVAQIREAGARVHDPHLRALMAAFLDDPEIAEGLQRAAIKPGQPPGTLAEHILSVLKLVLRVSEHYPFLDRDLLIAGAVLYDIGKVRGVSLDRTGDAVDEARLVGQPVMTARAIRDKAAQVPGFPPLLEHHLTHLVLSQLGSAEHPAASVPMTLEALVLHDLAVMDAQISAWLELMSKDPHEKWTERSRIYDRYLWKGAIPTSRNKAPVEGRTRRRNGADKRKAGAAASAPPPRREEHKEEERRDHSVPKPMTFKPLSEIAPSAAASSEAQGTPEPEQ